MLYIDGDTDTVNSTNLECMSRTMKIFGTETMNMPGEWQVEFYYNNELLLQWSFEIKERCAARPALNEDSGSLNALRTFRDQTLYKTRFGQKAVDLFYEYSPALAKAMDDNPALKAFVRTLLKTCARGNTGVELAQPVMKLLTGVLNTEKGGCCSPFSF